MKLTKINGNTYFLPAPTNIGVYIFKDKYTLLIDSGNNNQQARKTSELLHGSGLNIKYIVNTHSHTDHCGGNNFFKEHHPGSVFLSSKETELFITQDFLFPQYLHGGNPPRELSKRFAKSPDLTMELLSYGPNKINNEKFTVIPLPGHAYGQLGIGTKDRVCFLADSLFSPEIIAKYSFPFLYDIEQQFNTYEMITTLDYDHYVLSHCNQVYHADEMSPLINTNRTNLQSHIDLIYDLLTQPKSKEDLVEEITVLLELEPDYKEYHFLLATVAAIITYLCDLNNLNYTVENGKLYYYRT